MQAGYAEIHDVTGFEKQPPTIRNDDVEIRGSTILGYKCVTTFRVKNTHRVLLDNLSARVEILDMERNIIKSKKFDLPDLLPDESNNQVLKVNLGRRISGKLNVKLLILRYGIEVERMHYTVE